MANHRPTPPPARSVSTRIALALGVQSVPALAEWQHGVVGRRQLIERGLTDRVIAGWLRNGRLHRIHPGVYALGHRRIDATGVRMAALLTCRPGSFIGRRSGIAWHALLADNRSSIDVVVPGRGVAGGPATVNVSRMTSVHPDDVTADGCLHVASVARSLVDGAGALRDRELAKAIKEAEYLRVLDVRAVLDALERTPTRPGAGRLRNALGADQLLLSREEFVLRYVALCEQHALDIPQIDVRLDTGLDSLGQIDLLYADEKVIIELDGAQAHMTRTRFEEDRRRDAYLAARGYLTLRFTWRRLIAEYAAIASEVRAVLDSR